MSSLDVTDDCMRAAPVAMLIGSATATLRSDTDSGIRWSNDSSTAVNSAYAPSVCLPIIGKFSQTFD